MNTSAQRMRVSKSRANNPELDRKSQAERSKKALKNKTYHCDICNISFTTRHSLKDHLKSPKHARKVHDADNPIKCVPCNLSFHNQSNLNRHNRSGRHRKAIAADVASPSEELD